MYMSATTLRVDEVTKKRFDELKELVEASTSEPVSQNQLVEWLVAFASDREPAFLKEREGPWRPWSREEVERFFEEVPDLSIETDANRIDEDLYGSGH